MASTVRRFAEVYQSLCIVLAAQGSLEKNAEAIGPSDCVGGHADSTCASPVAATPRAQPPSSPPPVPPPSSYPLAGQPPANYWYWGYDFALPDTEQSSMPRFVNRSGRAATIILSFTIPNQPCGGGCLPGVEFYFDQGVHKVEPRLAVSGNTATATMHVNDGDRFAWVIGLWQASNPTVSVLSADGSPLSPEAAGLSPRPDISILTPGITTLCQCEDALTAMCNYGDHFSNGLAGEWSRHTGLYRFNAWNNCAHGGG
jgi:hypothetical protein